jgi:hypothetical protein
MEFLNGRRMISGVLSFGHKNRRAIKIGLMLVLLGMIVGSLVVATNQASAIVGDQIAVFEVGVGEGEGQIKYVIEEEAERWGPISFTVLNNGNIAVLDSGNRRILILDQEGSQIQEIPYEEVGLISPMDLVEWKGQLAVVEANTSPQAVVTIDMETHRNTKLIPLPDALAEHRPKFVLGESDRLQLLEGGAITHVVADNTGDLAVSAIAQGRSDLQIKGFGEVRSRAGVRKQGVAPAVSLTTQSGSTEDMEITLSGVPATWAEPLGKSRRETLMLYTSYSIEGQGARTTRFYVEERSAGTLQPRAYASIPVGEFYVVPARFVTVSSSGEIWCMVPEKDRVGFVQLIPNSGAPDFSLASSALTIKGAVVNAVGSVWRALAPRTASAHGGVNSPWTRDDGDGTAYGYYNLDWYCNSEAYYRSCGVAGGDGADGNRRPRYITTYNVYYDWAPYQWGGFDTAASIRDHVGDSGNDAGDFNSGDTLACPMGVDCSGFVSRLWGLQTKHSTATLLDHATTVSNYSQMLIGDMFDLSDSHCIWYRFDTGNGANCYEATTWNSWDRVANSLRNPDELIASGYGMYRSTTWN